MKKTIRTILCAAAVVMTSVSCQKSAEPATPAEEGKETIDICVNGLMGEYTQVDATKAELVNTVRVSWKGDETVYVYDGTQCLGSLKASLEGTEDRYALLSTDETHIVNTPASGTTTLTLVYSPLLTKAPAVNDDAISISLASQSGEKAPFVAYATLDYTSTTITNAVVPFKFATSVIKVNCTGLKPDTAITSATLSNVNTACKLTLSGDKAPVVAGGTNGTITRTGDSYFAAGKINDEGEAVFQIAVPKLETASGARVLTVAQSLDKAKEKKFTTKSLEPATSVNTVCQLVGLPVGALVGEFTVSDDGGATTKQIYFSQGNLYAVASGDTFVSYFEANQYDFRTYNGWRGGSCIDGDYNKDSGTPPGHYGLFSWSSTVEDAVGESNNGDYLFTNDPYDEKKPNSNFKVNVGGTDQTGWRTLSEKEWEYLFKGRNNASNLYKSGVTVYGVTNCVVIAPDDWDLSANFLQSEYSSTSTPMTWEQAETAGLVCLPAAGYRNSSFIAYEIGVGGFYSTSTAIGEAQASFVVCASTRVDIGSNYYRNEGHSVRLITECQRESRAE